MRRTKIGFNGTTALSNVLGLYPIALQPHSGAKSNHRLNNGRTTHHRVLTWIRLSKSLKNKINSAVGFGPFLIFLEWRLDWAWVGLNLTLLGWIWPFCSQGALWVAPRGWSLGRPRGPEEGQNFRENKKYHFVISPDFIFLSHYINKYPQIQSNGENYHFFET